MFAFFLSPLGKFVGVGLFAFIIGGIGAGYAVHLIDNGAYQKLVADQAKEKAAANAAALAQVEMWAKTMHDAAAAYQASQSVLTDQIDAIQRGLRNAQIRHPLVTGCVPDADRVRALQSGIDAANRAASSAR